MTVVCPEFIAFKGPSEGPHKWPQAPADYISVFKAAGVTDVVRLNEASSYDSVVFERDGMRHNHSKFPDCSVPSQSIIRDFLGVCDAAKGPIAWPNTGGRRERRLGGYDSFDLAA
jgi:cell division cycle 14